MSLPLEKRLWISIMPAIVAAILLALPFARLLGMTPLMVFSGPCPACRRRPPGWWNYGTGIDRLQLACGECGQQVGLWLTSPRPAYIVSADVPTYVLRRPGLSACDGGLILAIARLKNSCG